HRAGAGRLPAPVAGPEIQRCDGGLVRRGHPRSRVLPSDGDAVGWNPPRHHADRLECRTGLRAVFARRAARREALGRGHGGGGQVTSLTYSPRLEKNIGYALLGIDHAKIGTRLRVSTSKGTRAATVVKKPFVDPKKDIPKS